MNTGIIVALTLCVFAIFLTAKILRRSGVSLGLPFAYLAALMLDHAPGAYAHAVRTDLFTDSAATERGIWLTAVGALSFTCGVWLSRGRDNPSEFSPQATALDRSFWLFCLLGGWGFVYALAPLTSIPSLGAIIEKGGGLWMLGVCLALRTSLWQGHFAQAIIWSAALAVYPTLMLLFGGFLSYGALATIIVASALIMVVRSTLKLVALICVVAYIGISLFTTYFDDRSELRSVIWSNSSLGNRTSAVTGTFSGFEFINTRKDPHALALDERLNHNKFVGLAAQRLDAGVVDYVGLRPFYEGILSLVPRALWPGKPVFGGSGTIVSDMTGLWLSNSTSWGVGQVMEFYISFGYYSLVLGFIVLGWVFADLDYRAAGAIRQGSFGRSILFFLPATALVAPIWSMVELVGGAGAAYIAALAWRYAWDTYIGRRQKSLRGRRLARRHQFSFEAGARGPKPHDR